MSLPLYQFYGLTVVSDLPLPELLPATPGSIPAITIGFGPADPDHLDGATSVSPFYRAHARHLWLSVPEVARYLVADGERITIEPLPGSDEASIRIFLLGSCLGALLFQRGFLVLHGNAIQVGDGCLVCAGHSGTGKSTLAASFLRQGHRILADDMVAVNEAGAAIPGFPRLKLWRDAARQLGIDTGNLQRIRPGLEKFSVPLGNAFCDEILPIRWLYILHISDRPGHALEPIHGMARFEPLRHNTYRLHFMEGMTLQASHLHLCGRLAGRIHLARVYRARTGLAPDDLAGLLLDDALHHARES